ncbi:hypothetical protein, partial [Pseudomonas aeruginosa]|uniref:hypothetical protein n=1 Tax=Pseudomonas aeruginosa TaxID=287 RepID=UPI001F344C57
MRSGGRGRCAVNAFFYYGFGEQGRGLRSSALGGASAGVFLDRGQLPLRDELVGPLGAFALDE